MDYAELIDEILCDCAGIFGYTIGIGAMFVFIFSIVYGLCLAFRVFAIYATTRIDLLQAKLEEKADRDFDSYCRELDTNE